MNQMELSFSAKIENEPFARTSVASFVTALNPTIDELVEIKTIVSEGVSNAIIHGYQNNPNCNVVIKVTIEQKRKIKIIIQDYGKGIDDIEAAKQPMYSSLKELEHAGMGLTIIEALCDRLEIHSTLDLGTKLTIIKQLKENDYQSE
ncbi:anti-sigma F factor [uncultured Thomasclavelia sp.]|uniref:anti-sigma F factor n=1 Tax=uncultured Thomasclavelia sp. TaxID=3025759 RepID=UPI0025FABE1D|nr:anti-sigma F factor [uncultured Thomasclavelia sp.]